MTITDLDPKAPHPMTTVLKRTAGPLKVARRGGEAVARQVPPTVKAAQSGARTAAGVLQTRSNSTLRSIAAASIGLSAGLYVSGKHRLALAAGLVPAVVAAIALRGKDGSIDVDRAADMAAEPPIASA